MTRDPPQFVQPAPDPALATLTQQNQQQQNLVIQDRVSSESARLMTMYGTRVATAGDTNWSPLVYAAPPAGIRARPAHDVAVGAL